MHLSEGFQVNCGVFPTRIVSTQWLRLELVLSAVAAIY